MIHERFILEGTELGDPVRMRLKELKLYWEAWVLEEAKGIPFSFLDNTEAEGENQGKQGDGQSEEEQEQEEDNQETHSTINKLPTPPTPASGIDHGIPLPSQCDTPAMHTSCLQQLVPKWGNTGKTFHTLVQLVDDLEVSSVLIIDLLLYLTSFQNTDIPSGYNSKWPFTKWSWNDTHLTEEIHGNRHSLDNFMAWLNQEASGLSEQASLNKNQLQELLLGVGLYIRDHTFACFTDFGETPVPRYLKKSKMSPGNIDSITRVMKLCSNAINDSGYVPCKTGSHKH